MTEITEDLKKVFITTHSGIEFTVFDPKQEQILIEDIAHALSQICRFGGHCSPFFSVAQHSINASYHVPKEHALCALLHDSTEAFLGGDFCSPIKKQMKNLIDVETRLHEVIGEKFSIPFPMPKEIKETDNLMFEAEWMYFMAKKPVPGLEEFYEKHFKKKSIERVKHEFLHRYKELIGDKKCYCGKDVDYNLCKDHAMDV